MSGQGERRYKGLRFPLNLVVWTQVLSKTQAVLSFFEVFLRFCAQVHLGRLCQRSPGAAAVCTRELDFIEIFISIPCKRKQHMGTWCPLCPVHTSAP